MRTLTSEGARAQASASGHRRQGELQVQLIYKPFEDEEEEKPGEPEPYELLLEEENITDIKSAAGAAVGSFLVCLTNCEWRLMRMHSLSSTSQAARRPLYVWMP